MCFKVKIQNILQIKMDIFKHQKQLQSIKKKKKKNQATYFEDFFCLTNLMK